MLPDTTVPPPGRDRIVSSPSTAASRSRMFVRPAPGLTSPLNPAPSSRTSKRSSPSSVREMVALVAPAACFDDVLEPLQAAEVDGALELLRVAADAVRHDLRGDRRVQGGGTQGLAEALVGEQGGIDPVGQRPDLLERLGHLRPERVQLDQPAFLVLPHQVLRQLELDPERHEPLLCAVVEVALERSSLAIRAGGDAGA